MALDIALLRPIKVEDLKIESGQSIPNIKYVFDLYENDIQFDDTGKLIMTEGQQKFLQNLLQIFLTNKGKNLEDPEYGSGLLSLIGQKLDVNFYTELNSIIDEAFIKYNSLNETNENMDEYIYSLDNVEILQDPNDPRFLWLKLYITLQSGNTITPIMPLSQELLL